MERNVICNICGKSFITIGHHIKIKHGISIDEYLNQYPGSIISNEEFLQNRREKVKKTCNTEEFKAKMSEIGYKNNTTEERRKLSSEILKRLNSNKEFRESGVKAWREKLQNPEFSTKHSEKLSESTKKQWARDYDKLSKSVGPHMWKSELCGRSFRSFAEMFLAEQLTYSDIQFQYELERFTYYCTEYNKERSYIPDFYIPSSDLYIEVKYRESEVTRTVAEKLLSVLNSGKQIILAFHNDIVKSPSIVSYLLTNNIQSFIEKTNDLILSATTIESISDKKDIRE